MKTLPMPTTSPERLQHALKRSLIEAGAAKDAGLTWAEFKAAVEALGITDGTPIAYIEYGVAQGGLGYLVRDNDVDGGTGIKEL